MLNNTRNAAFYYMAEGYQTSGKSIMGRQSAGEGFLSGFAKHAGVDRFYCYGPNVEQYQHFQRSITQATGKGQSCSFIPFAHFPSLSQVGCLFVPGPCLSNDAWVRRSFNSRAYSICGVTHTTATERIMDSIGALLIDPVQSWDAIVCTSTVVKKTLERVIDSYADYLEDRMGVRPQMSVQLPIIPLGVDCEQFSPPEGEAYRAAWRDKLGITDDAIAVLYVGRLNFTAKAHPLPMFLALEEAARQTGKQIHLLLAGWFDPPTTESLWREDAQKFCPSVTVAFLDGRQEDIRREIWSAADIFTSLSDNIQETFGLTPIEAMAAGLPVVVTDWDGYRDTVRDGIDGFRVPVFLPEPGRGEELAIRFANNVDSYGRYCGSVSQMTSVDLDACVAAYVKLIQDKALRSKLGEAGRQRAVEQYDWRHVVRQYQELWQELTLRRMRELETAPRSKGKQPLPLRLDPFELFQEYPTDCINSGSLLALRPGNMRERLEQKCSSVMNSFAANLLLSQQEQVMVIEYLAKQGPVTVDEIIKLFPAARANQVVCTVGWMGKNGIISIQVVQDN